MSEYPIESDRLRMRGWRDDDFDVLYRLCSDERVMRYFPSTLDRDETRKFLERLQHALREDGVTYYAAERKDDGNIIGFIGLAYQTYLEAPFTDVGWRLLPEYWGRGYATEGGRACLAYAFEELGLEEVLATTPTVNEPSLRVMRRLGMRHRRDFIHPNLAEDSWMQPIAVYGIKTPRPPGHA